MFKCDSCGRDSKIVTLRESRFFCPSCLGSASGKRTPAIVFRGDGFTKSAKPKGYVNFHS